MSENITKPISTTNTKEQPKQEAVKPQEVVKPVSQPEKKDASISKPTSHQPKQELAKDNKNVTPLKKGKEGLAKPKKIRNVSTDGFEEKVVAIKRISKTTKGGRNMRFSVLIVVGDRKGSVGFGIGKSLEIPNAMAKATKNAKNNIVKVKINHGTIYHDVIGKACAAKILLKPAKKGTGLVAGGAIRAVVELAGYTDIYTKNLGKNTAQNMIQATINGLKQQMTPEYIAEMRDKKVSEL